MRGEGSPESQEVHRIAERAIRRLDLLEYVLLGAAALLSLVAGALVAFLLRAAAGTPFRTTWVAMSLLFFIVPAVGTWLRVRREEASSKGAAAADGDHEAKRYRTGREHGRR